LNSIINLFFIVDKKNALLVYKIVLNWCKIQKKNLRLVTFVRTWLSKEFSHTSKIKLTSVDQIITLEIKRKRKIYKKLLGIVQV